MANEINFAKLARAIDRFFNYVGNIEKWGIEDECCFWNGYIDGRDGREHGRFKFNNKHYQAYRISYAIFHGQIDNNLLILHKCKSHGRCVNPLHLEQGTHKKNAEDRIRDGTQTSKLTIEQVREIKRKCANGEKGARIAREYGVGRATIHNIKQGIAWTTVQ